MKKGTKVIILKCEYREGEQQEGTFLEKCEGGFWVKLKNKKVIWASEIKRKKK